MRKLLFSCFCMFLAFFMIQCGGNTEIPHEVAGFKLGSNLDQYGDRVDMESRLPIRGMEFLSAVETGIIEGYQEGAITVGNCASPGRIVRLKMKYARSDKEFYDKLLELYKRRFGDPAEWRGDAFHTFIAWKWSFTDEDGNNLSMIFQHGHEEDEEHSSGNVVKLTNWTLIDRERECYAREHPEPKPEEEKRAPGDVKRLKYPEEYEPFVPK